MPFPPLLRPSSASSSGCGIDDELHRRLKVLAASRGVTLKALVVELLAGAVDQAEAPAKKPRPKPKR